VRCRYHLLLIFILVFLPRLKAQENLAFISFSMGWFDFMQADGEAFEGRIEYKSNLSFAGLKPFFGFAVTSDGAFNTAFGVYTEIFLFENKIVVTPSFSPCLFHDGIRGKLLKSELEFRSQVEISYRFKNEMRLGLSINHISNGGIKIYNPGTESFALNYSIPVKQIL